VQILRESVFLSHIVGRLEWDSFRTVKYSSSKGVEAFGQGGRVVKPISGRSA